MNATVDDPRIALMRAPMSTYQKVAIAVIVLLCMLDGFDVFAMTFAAPAIRTLWGITQSQIGLVLASGLLGMAAGSLVIAPTADLVGRRRLVFLSLIMMSAGTWWTSEVHTLNQLLLSRVFTGLGLGTLVAVINSLTAEYANSRRRDLCVTIFAVGFPLGGVVGGFLAGYLLPAYGWAAVFKVAAVMGLVMLVMAWTLLPEPIAPMIARPKPDTLARVNRYLQRCGMPSIATLPTPPFEAGFSPLKALFGAGLGGTTALITVIYFLHVITLFFMQSWIPSLIVAKGFPPAQAALMALWLNVGGIIGGLLLGLSSMRLGLKALVFAGLCGGAILTAVFGVLPASFIVLAVGAAIAGFCLQGGMMGLYAVVARTFPAHIRASGTGLVIGVGRIGSVLGPALAGKLMTDGVSAGSVAMVMAVPSLAAALLLTGFRVRPPDIP